MADLRVGAAHAGSGRKPGPAAICGAAAGGAERVR
jgi:hypothetical protein